MNDIRICYFIIYLRCFFWPHVIQDESNQIWGLHVIKVIVSSHWGCPVSTEKNSNKKHQRKMSTYKTPSSSTFSQCMPKIFISLYFLVPMFFLTLLNSSSWSFILLLCLYVEESWLSLWLLLVMLVLLIHFLLIPDQWDVGDHILFFPAEEDFILQPNNWFSSCSDSMRFMFMIIL